MLSCFSRVWLCETTWTAGYQASLSLEFSRQEHWSGLLCPPLGDLSHPGIEPASLTSPALGGGFFTTSATWSLLLLFNCSVVSNSLWPHGLQHARLPCPSPPPRACSNSCPSSRWCHPTVSPSVAPSPPAFYLLQHVFQWAGSWHQVAKVLEFQVHHQSFQRIFRVDFF